MKTGALIDALARGPIHVPAHAVVRRIGVAWLGGTALAALAMLGLLGLRVDLPRALGDAMFWMKLGYPLALATVAALAASRLARPAGEPRAAAGIAATIAAALVAAAGLAILAAAPQTRLALALGHSALACVVAVSVLALPVAIATFAALRTLAPTRLRAAGAAAGLLAGASAAAVYAWHCDETALAFLGTWYTLGMAVPTALGAWLGPRLLRWA